MNPPPSNWTNIVTKAASTLLIVAFTSYVVWFLLQDLLPVLLIVFALIGILRIATGWSRRDRW